VKARVLDFAKYQQETQSTYLILLSAPILLTIYYYHGFADSFLTFFPRFQNHVLLQLYQLIFQFTSFFVLFLVFPLFFTRLYLKRSFAQVGLGLGDYRFGLKLAALAIPVLIVPLIFIASRMPEVRAEYPLVKVLFTRHDLVLWYELAYVGLYYVAWEFYFRGFLLFGIRETLGDFMAVVIQTIPSSLIHFGKPEGETIGSIIAGIVFGVVALRTKSIWYGFLAHATIGVLTDLFIIFG
jgi:membrane protease YdiL (CAAX protease family)